MPESLVNTAKLYPTAKTLTSHAVQGHDILHLMLQVRPNVLNHPAHPKHEVIPSGVFMPGKDGTPVHTTEELQQLIRLLHREHGRLGGTIAVCSNCSCATVVVPLMVLLMSKTCLQGALALPHVENVD